MTQPICGTLGYFAPEILKNQEVITKSDVFSIGSLLFNIFTGRSLFNGQNKNEVMYKNRRCILPNNIEKYLFHYSDEAKQLLFWLLESNPNKRPEAAEALKHKWFKDSEDGI